MTDTTRHIILGAGGHAQVLADALLAAGKMVACFATKEPVGGKLFDLPVLTEDQALKDADKSEVKLVLGLGSTRGGAGIDPRVSLWEKFHALGWNFASVVHPSAIVSPFAHIGENTQLLARSVVQVGGSVGQGCIVNTGAVLEHGCNIGEFSHVSIGAIICGDVHIGAKSHVGAGSVIRQSVVLGDQTTIGAGAVVLNKYSAAATLVGNPAKPMVTA